jgi:ABC-type cobalt transport system substrate-binding protein
VNALSKINRILAIAIIVWAIAVPVYLFGFARVSYTSTTSSTVQGEAPVTETTSGSQPWFSAAEPVSVLILLAFSGLLTGGGIAVWKDALAEMTILAMLALVGSYMTGFSIGGLYLPGAIALALATVLSAVAVRIKRNAKD